MSYHSESAGVTTDASGARPLRLFDEVSRHMRIKYNRSRNKQRCMGWIHRFALVHGRRSLREGAGAEVFA